MKSRFMMLAVTLVAFILGLTGPVAAAPAPDDNSVLILGPTVTDPTFTGDSPSNEEFQANLLGFTVEVATASTWSMKSQADFGTYRAIILGDPTCSGDPSAAGPLMAALANSGDWGPAIDGNVICIGTDPTWHSIFGPARDIPRSIVGGELTRLGIAYAADLAARTGAYITLSCYYAGGAAGTAVPVLDPFGSFTVTTENRDAVVIVAPGHPALGLLTDGDLSGWGNSVHEVFDSFDPSFEPLVTETTSTDPYILARDANTFVAVVEPAGDDPVEVFSAEGDPDNLNPFISFIYPKVTGGGIVTALCCTFEDDDRETAGSGRGRRLFYDPTINLDIGLALRAAVTSGFDPTCAAVYPLVPVGDAIARPWQRISPDPDPDGSDPLGRRNYANFDYVDQRLVGAFCVVDSAVDSVGPAVTVEDPSPLVGYESDCDEDDTKFRPVTGTVSLAPGDENSPFFQTATGECDGSRSARRSSITGYWINMRNDTTQNSGFALVNRHMSDLNDEIVAVSDDPILGLGAGSCVDDGGPSIVTGPLLAKWLVAKELLNKHKKKEDDILEFAIPALEELSLLALAIPECPGNPNGLIGGLTISGTFLACSYLGHPDAFVEDEDCLISNDILEELGLPLRPEI